MTRLDAKIAALVMATPAVLPSMPVHAQTAIRQVCSGVLTKVESGYLLKPDAGSSLWCDATFGDENNYGDADASVWHVLQVCELGSRCHIEGSVIGHGVFYWKHVSSVSRLEGRR